VRLTPVLLICAPLALGAQPSPDPKPPTAPLTPTHVEEERLARSAAPPAVSAHARLYVLDHGRYIVADSGTTGVACLVSRSQALSFEPECGDPEAEATILDIERFRTEQRLAGLSPAAVSRAVADSISSGRFRLPRRPAMVYMLSSAQILYDDQGKFVGRWRPHLMIYYPFLRESDIGLPAGSSDVAAPLIDKPGTPLSDVMIVMRNFVDPASGP
jgi:hypothetical protein